MNKKLLVPIVVLILLLLGIVGWYFASNKKTPNTAGNITDSVLTEDEQSGDSKSSIKDLFAKGESQTCTFNVSDESYTSEGIVYVSNGKMRGDFNMTNKGNVQMSHMIVADNTSYIWMDGQHQGYKMAFGEETKTETENQNNTNSVDVDAKVDYKCKPGVSGQSYFELPADVKFESFETMMKSGLPTGTQGTSSQCSACDPLSGDTKTQCLTMLKCN